MSKKISIFFIKVYQKTLSPDHGLLSIFFPHGFCRFQPTCSQYTIDAIEKFGALKGAVIGFYRINRCNPWSRGGVDKAEDAKPSYFKYGLILILVYIAVIFMLSFILARLIRS